MSLQENFDKAAAEVKAFSKRPDDSVLLQLYGLYKQATAGDNTTGTPFGRSQRIWQIYLLESNLPACRGSLGHPVRGQGQVGRLERQQGHVYIIASIAYRGWTS
jgi:hypothetical protein